MRRLHEKRTPLAQMLALGQVVRRMRELNRVAALLPDGFLALNAEDICRGRTRRAPYLKKVGLMLSLKSALTSFKVFVSAIQLILLFG
jgi:hypothetical protein